MASAPANRRAHQIQPEFVRKFIRQTVDRLVTTHWGRLPFNRRLMDANFIRTRRLVARGAEVSEESTVGDRLDEKRTRRGDRLPGNPAPFTQISVILFQRKRFQPIIRGSRSISLTTLSTLERDGSPGEKFPDNSSLVILSRSSREAENAARRMLARRGAQLKRR